MSRFNLFKNLSGKCPKCHQTSIFDGFLKLHSQCSNCKLNLTKCYSPDGPTFVLTFILSTLVTPLAIYTGLKVTWPLYIQALLWGSIITFLAVLLIRPLKSLFLALDYHYRSK